jgi:hypothetical protein
MDPRERIALWVALVVLLVFVLVRSSSSFVGSQMSFVDLAEFDTLPSDLKKMYYDTMVNGVAKEAGKKVTDMWAALTPAQKDEAKAQAAKQAKTVIEQIQSGKGGVMVLPPAQGKIADAAKPQQGPVPMQGKIAEVKPAQDFGMKMGQMQGKIAEVKPAQDFGMKMGLAPQQQDFIKGMPGAYAQPQKETAMKTGEKTMTIGGQITPQGIDALAKGKDMAFKTAGGGFGAVAYS